MCLPSLPDRSCRRCLRHRDCGCDHLHRDCTNLWEIEWGNLSNSGATIEITDAFGNQVDIVAYDDAAPWPVEADGDCPTLELNDPNPDNNDGNNWHASTVTGHPV